MSKKIILVLCLGGVLSGCEGGGGKQIGGGVAGAVVGGLLGSQIGGGRGRVWAAGIGAGLGAILGSQIGAALDAKDKQDINHSIQRSVEKNETVYWENPQNGHRGYTETYASSEPDCRDYTTCVYIDGKPVKARGRACRDRNTGQWRIVN